MNDMTSDAAEDFGGETTAVADIVAPGLDDRAGSIQPRVRIREEHNISRRDIDPDALKVLYRLARNNYIAYLVGGGVRDLLLGRKPKDFDISTNARPEQIRALFRNCILIGRRFRLAHIRYGEKIIETSTFRRTPESAADPTDPEADLFQRDDNLFGSPQEDALRRDFTVNGLFYDIETFSIIDYVGGMEDLAARRIRSIGDPCIRFREDPVRMIRAVRFASRLDFSLDPDTLEAIRKHGDELAKASPARLLEEITRLFAFSSGEKAVRLLQSTGLLKVILPEVVESLAREDGDGSGLWDRLRALDEGDTVLPDATPALIFATLLLDPLKHCLGRELSAEDFPKLKFDKVHAFLEPLAQRLRFPRKLVDRIVHMYLAQHRFGGFGGKRNSIANFVTQDSFHESLALSEIIHTAEGRSQIRLNQWRDMLAERIFGRDDNNGGHQERRRRDDGNNGNNGGSGGSGGNGAPVQNRQASEGPREIATAEEQDTPAGKLSRSARRRRNKRMKRLRDREESRHSPDAGENRPEGEAGGAEAPPPYPVAETAAVVEAAEAPAVAEEKVAEGKPAKSRHQRQRGKKKEAASERKRQEEGAGKREPADGGSEPVHPLTAADFYKHPEPEKKKARAPRKEKAASAKAAPERSGKKAERGENEPAKPKPLAMDRADEADIPMHWLDEI